MGWRKVSNGGGNSPIVRWEKVGQVQEGTFQGMVKLRQDFAPLAKMLDAQGNEYLLASPTVLQGVFETLPRGTMVQVIYTGEKASKKGGKPYKNFDVLVPDDTPTAEATPASGDEWAALEAEAVKAFGDTKAAVIIDTIQTTFDSTAKRIEQLRAVLKQRRA